MPYYFTPPTYLDSPGVEEADHVSLWRHYKGNRVGYSVLVTGGVPTPYPGKVSPTAGEIAAADDQYIFGIPLADDCEGGKLWFRGGITYVISDNLATVLDAAGYTDELQVIFSI